MGKREIKTELALDGETKFKDALSGIGRSMTLLNSELGKATAAYDKNDKSAEKLTATNSVLTQKMEVQKKKIAELNHAVEESVRLNGKDAATTQDYQIELNRAQAALIKMETELKKNNAALLDNVKNVGKADEKTRNWRDTLGKVSAMAGKGLAASAKAVGVSMAAIGTTMAAGVVGVAKFTEKALDNADAIQKQADITGLSAEKVQELSYVAATAGVDFDTLAGAQAKLTKAMAATAEKGTGPQAEAFKELGVAVKDSKGNLLDANIVMGNAFEKLKGVKNETERNALSMTLFGKAAMELNPLLRMSADEMAKLTEEARKTGAVISNENVAALDSAGDSIESLKQSAMGLGSSLVVSLLPAINGTIGNLKSLAGTVGEAIKTGDWSKVGDQISDILVDGIKSLAKALPGIIKVLLTILDEVVSLLVTLIPTVLPMILDAALQLIQGLLDAIEKNLDPLMEMVITMLTSFVNFLLKNLPMIVKVALKIVIALANGIAQSLPALIPVLVDTVMTIVDTLMENLPALLKAALAIILALAKGLVDSLPALIDRLPELIISIVTFLTESGPALLEGALQIVLLLAQGLIMSLPSLVAAIPTLITGMIDAFTKDSPLKDTGKNIIDGLWQGIESAWDDLVKNVNGLFDGMGDGIKKLLGIHSPSTVFAGIGENMAAGVGVGFEDRINEVQRKLNKWIPKPNNSTMAGAGASTGGAPVEYRHSGTIRVEGVNDKGQLVGVVEQIIEKRLRFETMMAGR